jgi:hypothetical protein
MNKSNDLLKWPENWDRTRIQDRRPMAGWKKTAAYYEGGLMKELERLDVVDVLLTYNKDPDARRDPGVAVYFSRKREEDYSWHTGLGLGASIPTLAEIEEAYKRLAMKHHPDRPGGDLETFRQVNKYRKDAEAWVKGTQHVEHEYSIASDRFNEVRLNINALRLAMAAMRQLDRVGIPGMLERSFQGMKAQLSAGEKVA